MPLFCLVRATNVIATPIRQNGHRQGSRNTLLSLRGPSALFGLRFGSRHAPAEQPFPHRYPTLRTPTSTRHRCWYVY
jgi:hypothetical protein